MASRQDSSVSPSRRKNTEQSKISALSSMLTRILSGSSTSGSADVSSDSAATIGGRERYPANSTGNEREDDDDRSEEADTVDDIELAKAQARNANPTDRSTSRGRRIQSSGRGGIGNITIISRSSRSRSPSRSPSSTRDLRAHAYVDGPKDFLETRGREPRSAISVATTTQPISIGRGGRGNIRSPSHPREVQSLGRSYAVEEELANIPTLAHGKADEIVVHSSGRGGLGNIRPTGPSSSRSRSRSYGYGAPGNLSSNIHAMAI